MGPDGWRTTLRTPDTSLVQRYWKQVIYIQHLITWRSQGHRTKRTHGGLYKGHEAFGLLCYH